MSTERDPKEILLETVQALADHPEEVRIDGYESAHQVTWDIHVARADAGKVLGRKGSYARALRTLFGAIYAKLGKRLHLQVIDPRR